MAIQLEKVAKIEAVLSSIDNADFKDWNITDNYTHIKVIDKDGDQFEITFTPAKNIRRAPGGIGEEIH